LVSAACAALTAAPSALAQGANLAVAEALFREGRAAMTAGDFATACPKFAESNRIDPKPGTLMNLALCHEKSGRSASAWAEYTEAATLAARAGQGDREKVAREHASALEPTLPHVIIEADPTAGEVIAFDDHPIGPAALKTQIPMDPGAHVLRATAPGATPFEQSFQVTPGGPVQSLTVPALAAAPIAQPERAAPASGALSRRTLAFVVGGVGVALAGVGAYFGAEALTEKNAAENGCGPNFCTSAGNSATSAMKTDETLSTIGVIAGLAAAGAGVYLFVTAAGETSAAPGQVSFGVTARGVRGQIVW
jgi:tetratricopeptide (TPR) repeat protein